VRAARLEPQIEPRIVELAVSVSSDIESCTYFGNTGSLSMYFRESSAQTPTEPLGFMEQDNCDTAVSTPGWANYTEADAVAGHIPTWSAVGHAYRFRYCLPSAGDTSVGLAGAVDCQVCAQQDSNTGCTGDGAISFPLTLISSPTHTLLLCI